MICAVSPSNIGNCTFLLNISPLFYLGYNDFNINLPHTPLGVTSASREMKEGKAVTC